MLTDDYSVQNVALFLDIKIQGVAKPGIDKVIRWKFKCFGCNKIFKNELKLCNDCGSKVKRISEVVKKVTNDF